MSPDRPQQRDGTSATGELLLCAATLLAAGLLPPLHAGVGPSLLAMILAAGLVLILPGLRPRHLLLLPLPLLCAAAPLPARAALLWLTLALARALDDGPRLRLASRTAAVATIYALAFSLPQLWGAFDALAAAHSRLLAALGGQALRLGPGALLHLPLFFLLRGLVQRAGGASWSRLGLAALGLLLQTAGLAVALRVGAGGALWWQAWLPAGSLLLFLALDQSAGASVLPATSLRPLPRRALLGLAGAALLLLAFLLNPPTPRLEGLEVGFRRAGLWSPERPSPRDDSVPRLGGMMAVLQAWGARVTVLDDRALEANPPCRVLFVVQPDTALSPTLRTALKGWLEKGGVLIAVGEHTHVHGIGAGLGSLLQDYHIRLRDDCAIPSLHGWLWSHDLRFLQSPATAGLRDSQDLGVSIGASLALTAPAWPLVTGSLAFADTGDSLNERGRMGNTRLDPGERLGEVPLLAAERVGRGLLVVLGDKSPLMSLNNPLVWPLYLNLTGRLAAAGGGPAPALLLALLLAAVLGLAPILRGLSWRAEAAAALLAGATLAWPLRTGRAPSPTEEALPRLVWIDQSHQANWWHAPDHDWSRNGIVEACFASQVVPLALDRLHGGLPSGPGALLVAGPARPYGRGERRRLRDFVAEGGTLVVAADGRRRAPVAGLLAEFGLALGDTPLGAAPEGLDAAGRPLRFPFWEAWPVEDVQGGADTLASCWGYALALRRQVGSGTVTVVGDERLFSRWSLEGSSRNNSWRSTATRFKRGKPPQPRPVAGEAKMDYLRRAALRMAREGQLAQGQPLPRPAAPRPAALPPQAEKTLRARWALALLGLEPAPLPPAPPRPGLPPGPRPAPGPPREEP